MSDRTDYIEAIRNKLLDASKEKYNLQTRLRVLDKTIEDCARKLDRMEDDTEMRVLMAHGEMQQVFHDIHGRYIPEGHTEAFIKGAHWKRRNGGEWELHRTS